MLKKRWRWFIWVCLFLMCHIFTGDPVSAQTTEIPKNPNSAKGCAICHYRWIDTFFVEGRGTDLVPYQSQKVAADPEMCFSCHDGSVMDSRARIRHGHEHKTGVAPPKNMSIPDIFPLDEAGKVQCATCHTAHGVASGPDTVETIFLRTSNRNSAMCRMCHPGKDGGPVEGNHSIGTSDKVIPEKLKKHGAHSGAGRNRMICETCHTAHGAPREGYLVIGAGDGELCLACHPRMGMFDPDGTRNANHAINVNPRVADLKPVLSKTGAKLGHKGVISCQTCHDIHDNETAQQHLLIRDNRQSEICLTCHPDKRRIKNTRHNLAVSAKTVANLEGETAVQAGMCSACHLPHKPALIPYKENAQTDRTTALCLSCHARGRIAENPKLFGYVHPVGIPLNRQETGADRPYKAVVPEEDALELPLYNILGVKDENGDLTCATCHDTHGGPDISGVPVSENGGVARKNTLLRRPSPEICRVCHVDKFDIENTGHDFKRLFPDGHPVLDANVTEPGLCRNCHRIHSTEPEGFVWHNRRTTAAGETVYDLCTPCHSNKGFFPEPDFDTNAHPVNLSLPDNITGASLPLFGPEGKPAADGIITCYTCHDPHARTYVKSATGKVKTANGRPVNRFLRKDIVPESDLCIDCHGDKAAVRGTDHNLVHAAPDATNRLNQTTYEAGVCGACHLAHNAGMPVDLWARQPGKGKNIISRMCNSCHSPGKVAGNKVPEVTGHPETLMISRWENDKKEPAFPLYDPDTAARVVTGNISCSSCHDAHRWDERGSAGAVNVEGDVTSSFLRPDISVRVCRECHGPDGLFMFKYFHKADARKTTTEEK